jgi:cytochrome c oxidase assembly protein subunit 15
VKGAYSYRPVHKKDLESPRKRHVTKLRELRMREKFSNFAWGVLAYNFFVILWGAWVRITGSGAGCGEHWPMCNGEVIPRTESSATFIEFTHRITSGISLPLTLVLVYIAFSRYPKGLTRNSAIGALVFLLSEALLGAGLVVFGLVDQNDSVFRAVVVSLHLLNTMALVAFGAVVAWSMTRKVSLDWWQPRLRWLWISVAALLLTSMAGAVTALGDTLFPVDVNDSRDLFTRLGHDVSAASHFLVRLRVVHPIIAVGSGVLLLVVCHSYRESEEDAGAHRWAWITSGFVLLQMLAGLINVALAAPGWMQLVHLLLADLLWVSLIVLMAEVANKK